jgi:cytochrome c oxidase subunit IV
MAKETTHIIGYRTQVIVWLLLLALTAITIAVSRVHLGPFNIWAALGIASLKSALVIFFFMHLKNEPLYLKLFLLIALLTLAIFIGLNFFDVLYR